MTRRDRTLRAATPALIAVLALLAAPRQADAETRPVAVVTGLADGDLLNIRATASAFGKVLGRLPTGAALEIFGCSEVDGYTWCRVTETGNPAVSGWTPARYLYTSGGDLPAPADIAAVEQAAAGTSTQAASASTPGAGAFDTLTEGANGDNIFVPGAAPNEGADAVAGAAPAASPSPDVLAARFGGGEDRPAAPPSAEATGLAAAVDAYAQAFAHAAGKTDGDDTPAAPAAQAAVPLPTPRPEAEPANEVDDQVVGEVQPPPAALAPAAQPAAQQATEIPCARYLGQPMTRCAAAVARSGTDAAEVTVTWPDGGTRIIAFRDGKPAGSNSRGELRFTREGALNMIRIGPSERFEITDDIPFGE